MSTVSTMARMPVPFAALTGRAPQPGDRTIRGSRRDRKQSRRRMASRLRATVKRGVGVVAGIVGARSGSAQTDGSSPATGAATLQDIASAYRMILRREPDADGRAHYGRVVTRGLSPESSSGA